jgi:hypothetical protein
MCRRGRAGRHGSLASVTQPYASVSLEHHDRFCCRHIASQPDSLLACAVSLRYARAFGCYIDHLCY